MCGALRRECGRALQRRFWVEDEFARPEIFGNDWRVLERT